MNNDIIFFMKVNEPYGEFANFHQTSFIFDGRQWMSSEHCYQAMKFNDFFQQEIIRTQPNAFMAAKEGRNKTKPIRSDWLMVRKPYMSNITFAKIAQNEHIKQLLLSTDNKIIVELSFKDNYWGSKPDLSGRNELGKILMQHRELFKVLG